MHRPAGELDDGVELVEALVGALEAERDGQAAADQRHLRERPRVHVVELAARLAPRGGAQLDEPVDAELAVSASRKRGYCSQHWRKPVHSYSWRGIRLFSPSVWRAASRSQRFQPE